MKPKKPKQVFTIEELDDLDERAERAAFAKQVAAADNEQQVERPVEFDLSGVEPNAAVAFVLFHLGRTIGGGFGAALMDAGTAAAARAAYHVARPPKGGEK